MLNPFFHFETNSNPVEPMWSTQIGIGDPAVGLQFRQGQQTGATGK